MGMREGARAIPRYRAHLAPFLIPDRSFPKEMRIELEPAFVLHARPYRDTSALLELFSLHCGRIGAVARGARGVRSKTRGLLQPFQPLLAGWSGGGELKALTAVEAAGPPFVLPPARTLSGLYLNELLVRLTAREDPQPELFAYYRAALARLAEPLADEQTALRLFECDLLGALGYGLALEYDAAGVAIVPERRYRYRPDAGALPEGEAGGEGIAVGGAALLALAAGRLDAAVLPELKALMRALLDGLLGSRPLRARELARALARRERKDGAAS